MALFLLLFFEGEGVAQTSVCGYDIYHCLVDLIDINHNIYEKKLVNIHINWQRCHHFIHRLKLLGECTSHFYHWSRAVDTLPRHFWWLIFKMSHNLYLKSKVAVLNWFDVNFWFIIERNCQGQKYEFSGVWVEWLPDYRQGAWTWLAATIIKPEPAKFMKWTDPSSIWTVLIII